MIILSSIELTALNSVEIRSRVVENWQVDTRMTDDEWEEYKGTSRCGRFLSAIST